MLDFTSDIDAYKEVLRKNKGDEGMSAHIVEKLVAMNQLNGRNESELDALFDTGAFNDIVRGYLFLVLRGCDMEKQVPAAMEELKYLFDTVSACEARNSWL